MIAQTVYDQGSYAASWTCMPFADPGLMSSVPDPRPPSPEHTDLSAGLMDAREIMAGLTYGKDQANLAKARSDRLRLSKDGSGGGQSSSAA